MLIIHYAASSIWARIRNSRTKNREEFKPPAILHSLGATKKKKKALNIKPLAILLWIIYYLCSRWVFYYYVHMCVCVCLWKNKIFVDILFSYNTPSPYWPELMAWYTYIYMYNNVYRYYLYMWFKDRLSAKTPKYQNDYGKPLHKIAYFLCVLRLTEKNIICYATIFCWFLFVLLPNIQWYTTLYECIQQWIIQYSEWQLGPPSSKLCMRAKSL